MHKFKKRLPLIKKGQDGLLLPGFTGSSLGNITNYADQFKNYGTSVANSMQNKTDLAFSLGNNLSSIMKTPNNIQNLDSSATSNNLFKVIGSGLTKASGSLSKPIKGISGSPSVGGLTTSALSIADKFIPQAEDKASKITSGVFNGLSSAAQFIPGVGPVASVALKGLGTLFGAGVKNVKGNAADELVDTSSSYTGADAYDSKKFGLLGLGSAKRYQNKVEKRQWERDTAHNILQTGKDDLLASSNVQQLQLADNLNKNASGWMYNVRAGKKGMKLQEAKRLARLAKQKKAVVTSEPIKEGSTIESYRNGGSMNVIPDGALHARKHNLTEINPELEGITNKGIPVITQEEGGIVQHAEVEVGEIIFTKEVTDKLEELRKIGTDEAAIEAGKLLAQQVMENTIDNTKELLNNED